MKKPIVIIIILIAFCLLWAFVKTDKPTAQAPQAAAQPINAMTDDVTDDEKRESENARKIAEAQKAFDAKNVDKPVYAEFPSESRSMDFDECKKIQASTLLSSVGTKTKVFSTVTTDILTSIRVCTTDGSVLLSCSKPDNKMVVTKSPYQDGCD